MSRTAVGTVIGLILGGAAGFAAGYFFSKNKFEAKADKEIESVRKMYEKHFLDSLNNPPVQEQQDNSLPKKSITPPSKGDDEDGYNHYAGMYKGESLPPEGIEPQTTIDTGAKKPKKVNKKTTPYVITPDQFNDSEFRSEALIWYADKVLADTDGNVIHNINEVIGPEALSTFGRYMDDTVYVRDDEKQIDYEIIWDARKFSSLKRIAGDQDED